MALDKRILEYALKGLEAERDVIEAAIAEVRASLGGRIARARRQGATKALRNELTETARQATKAVRKKASRSKKKIRKLSTAQRQAISERMKQTWARRRRQRG